MNTSLRPAAAGLRLGKQIEHRYEDEDGPRNTPNKAK
jgi:hypothetical protein